MNYNHLANKTRPSSKCPKCSPAQNLLSIVSHLCSFLVTFPDFTEKRISSIFSGVTGPPDICGDKQWWEWRKSCSPQQRPLPRGIRTPPPNTLFTPTQHLVTKLPKPISCNLLRSTNHMCSIVWFQFVFIRIILQKKIHTAFEVLAGGSRLEDTYLAKWRKWRKTKHWSLSICATIMQISQISWKGKKIQRYGHRRMKIYSLQTVSDFSKGGTVLFPHPILRQSFPQAQTQAQTVFLSYL